MPTPTVDKLRVYYPGKQLVADGGTLTKYTADSGSETTITDAALTEADDYFNGGVVIFQGDSATVALRGRVAHIKDFDAASDTITLAKSLPAPVAAGDTYKIVIGGNYRSDTELMGLIMDGVFPELNNIVGPNISGLTIKYCSPSVNEDPQFFGAVTVDWFQSTSDLSIDGGFGFGPTYNVTGDATDVILEAANGGFIIVDIVQASLPVGDQQDTYTLDFRPQTYTPDIEGYESKNAEKGKTRYRLQVVKNTDGVDQMTSSGVYLAAFPNPGVFSQFINDPGGCAITADEFEMDDATDWPTAGFWIRNLTKGGDCRYVESRSGTTFKTRAANDWTKFVCDANNTVEPLPGQTMTSASGGSGIIDQVLLHSGTWAGGDANATIYLKGVTGTFQDTDQLQVSAVNIALQSGGESKGLRDNVAVAWDDGDEIEIMPSTDIAVEAPTANQFSDPSSETEYPDEAMVFSDPNSSSPLSIGSGGNMIANEIYGVWTREWIMDDSVASSTLYSVTEYTWS